MISIRLGENVCVDKLSKMISRRFRSNATRLIQFGRRKLNQAIALDDMRSEPSVVNNRREISAFNLSYDEFSISELT